MAGSSSLVTRGFPIPKPPCRLAIYAARNAGESRCGAGIPPPRQSYRSTPIFSIVRAYQNRNAQMTMITHGTKADAPAVMLAGRCIMNI